jgi:CHAD domain-containing protein
MQAVASLHVLHESLERQWCQLGRWAARAHKRNAPKPVHELRIATRRLQELTELAAEVIDRPKVGKTLKRLERIRRAAGRARNSDVLIDLVSRWVVSHPDEHSLWEPILAHLEEHRPRTRNEMQRALADLDPCRLGKRWKKALVSWPHGDEAAALRVGVHLTQHMAQRHREFSAALRIASAPNARTEQIHAMRIAGKRLRYALEVAAELGNPEAETHLEHLRGFQKTLGDWNDLEMLGELIADHLADKRLIQEQTARALALLDCLQRLRAEQKTLLYDALERGLIAA